YSFKYLRLILSCKLS
uniref:Uncharacterized protein n=1 Tax=Amphimedon queenslandica TaxID=400682 RepID=A0A1X7TYQ9_AMPQE